MTRDQILNEIVNQNSKLRAASSRSEILEIQKKRHELLEQLNRSPKYELNPEDFRAL